MDSVDAAEVRNVGETLDLVFALRALHLRVEAANREIA